ncbi:MAG TPA: glycosyltransferase family 9 protein [Candidatus Baltobacteraceae bacterium]|nr:glycosyltransferase family 9 protein [Candidatus Baltobacteraceae bacterium]
MAEALLYCAGGGIGDSIMASLVARALRERFSRVDALTLPAHRETLERIPDLDGVLVDDGSPERALAGAIAQRSYGAAVVTWATGRTAKVPFLARIPVRVGQARRMYSWRFTTRVPVRSESGDVTTHWSQILLDYARAIGCDTADPLPRIAPTAQDGASAQALLAQLCIGPRFLILHTTNAIAPRRGIWPLQGWIALARGLQDRFEIPVLLSGAHDDRPIVESIARASGAHSIAGHLSIGAFAALASAAAQYVGITTGTMHVAAAVGCPTVGIFPFQTDVPERWGPLGPHAEVVRASYPCRAGERKETCPDYACIANLDVPRVLAACEALQARSRRQANHPRP